MNSVRFTVVLAVRLIWLVVGFYLWVPAVVVSSLLYAVGLLAVAFLSEPHLEAATKSMLEESVSFYGVGFQRITQAARGEFVNEKPEFGTPTGTFIFFLLATAGAIAAATCFWYVAFFLILHLFQR